MQLIDNCTDCTIKTFISARFDNKMNLLVIDGNPTQEELLKAITDIETEFNDLSGQFPAELVQLNRVNKLTARNTAVGLFLTTIDEVVRRIFEPLPEGVLLTDEADVYLDKPILTVKNAITELRRFGVTIKWTKDITEFKKSIKAARTREITKDVELEELSFELDNTRKQSTKHKEYTKKDFYHLLHAVEALGFKVSESETNMYSYGVMCGDFFTLSKNNKSS